MKDEHRGGCTQHHALPQLLGGLWDAQLGRELLAVFALEVEAVTEVEELPMFHASLDGASPGPPIRWPGHR